MADLSGYTVLFDLSTSAYQPPWFSLIADAGLAMAMVAIFARARGTGLKVATAVGFCFVLLFALATTWAHWSESQSLRRAMSDANLNIAEGKVERFQPILGAGTCLRRSRSMASALR